MLAQSKDELRALRSIKSMILLAESSEGAAGGDLPADAEIKLLTKAAKQRKDLHRYLASRIVRICKRRN